MQVAQGERRQPPSTCDVVSWGLLVLVGGFAMAPECPDSTSSEFLQRASALVIARTRGGFAMVPECPDSTSSRFLQHASALVIVGVTLKGDSHPVHVTSSRGVCSYSWRGRDGTRVSGLNGKQVSPTRVDIGHGGRYTSKINPFEFGCVLSWWACFLLTTHLAYC